MEQLITTTHSAPRDPWNKGKLVGQKAPLRLKEIWAIRIRLQLAQRTREQVLAAIRDERFYILTHPEYNPIIEQRMKDILSGANPAMRPPPGR